MPGSLQFGEQQRQRTVENRCNIAARYPAPQQVLRLAQLLMRFARDGELHLVPFRRERRDLGARFRILEWGRNRGRFGRCGRSYRGDASIALRSTRGAFGAGSWRTDEAAAGSGRSVATISSTSRLLLCRAIASTCW